MTKAAQELEIRRRQRAENELLQAWWWFDSAHANEKCEAALTWETLRRTKSYAALWRKAIKEGLHQQPQTKNTLAAALQRYHLVSRLRQALPSPLFDFLAKGFDPQLSWLQLADWQRLEARGYMMRRDMLPRRTAASIFAVVLGLCEIKQDSSGKFTVEEYAGSSEKTALRIASEKFFQDLKLCAPAKYFCIYFDTRLSRETLLAAWDMQITHWPRRPQPDKPDTGVGVTFDPNDGTTPIRFWTPELTKETHAKPTEVHVIPSHEPGKAICLIPAKYGLAIQRGAFHTQLKRRAKWFRHCIDYWNTLTISTGKKLFNPAIHQPQRKSAKTAKRNDLWLGLAANDVVKMGASLFAENPKTKFLWNQCKAWGADYSKLPHQHVARRRKCSQQLRNCQVSAAKRLSELDASFGRADKTLAHWLQKNAELEQNEKFAALAEANLTSLLSPASNS